MHTLTQLRSGILNGITSLKLSERLTTFPEEIFELADTLEILDLSSNNLSSLPANFSRLKKLRILFCSNNLFTVLPEVLADCPLLEMVGFKANQIKVIPPRALNPNLRWLILTDNRIEELPATIGGCIRMQKLMLAGNRLTSLPTALQNCTNLALLRISANNLVSFPSWLLSMPKLAWFAFSGNPCCMTPRPQTIPTVHWSQLKMQQVLGEGASGNIYEAELTHGPHSSTVAVKVFKGTVTSDGLPEDEMKSFMAAGNHSCLTTLLGEITDHPEGKKGLVMKLIPKNFINLGMPPTFETCTRDVFKKDFHLTETQILCIATSIAALAQHLHDKGIMHGDLYAHNILIDDQAEVLMGDFGAASFYDKRRSPSLELLEVAAYGYLLDDLLSLNTQPSDITNKLATLRDECIQEKVVSRPTFQSINYRLALITPPAS